MLQYLVGKRDLIEISTRFVHLVNFVFYPGASRDLIEAEMQNAFVNRKEIIIPAQAGTSLKRVIRSCRL